MNSIVGWVLNYKQELSFFFCRHSRFWLKLDFQLLRSMPNELKYSKHKQIAASFELRGTFISLRLSNLITIIIWCLLSCEPASERSRKQRHPSNHLCIKAIEKWMRNTNKRTFKWGFIFLFSCRNDQNQIFFVQIIKSRLKSYHFIRMT